MRERRCLAKIRGMSSIGFAAALAVGFTCRIMAADTLSCIFVETSGEPIKKVEARIIPQDEQDEQVEAKYAESDKNGQLEFSGLEPGSYLLQAQRKGYVPLELMIEVPREHVLRRVLMEQKQFSRQDEKARELLREGQYQEAREQLETLHEYYPRDAVILDNLARAHAGLLHEEESLRLADKAGELSPRFSGSKDEVQAIVWQNEGQNALQAKEFEKAAARFEALSKLQPQNPTAHHGLALAYGHQGEFEKALAAIDKAIQLAPDNSSFKLIRRALRINAGIE